MNKVTLEEAYNIYKKKLKNLKGRNIYKSTMIEKEKEDMRLVEEVIKLQHDIRNAERISGIEEYNDLLSGIDIEKKYYTTENSNVYPVEHFTKKDREWMKEQYSYITTRENYIKSKVEELSKVTFIEL